MSICIKQYPNLEITSQVYSELKSNKSLTEKARASILTTLIRLNDFGTNHAYVGKKNLKNLGNGWWELRIRDKSNEWRILFRKIKNSHKYGLIYMFLKNTNEISSKDWSIAKSLASSEGWI